MDVYEKMSFGEWVRLAVASFLAGACIAVPGLILTLFVEGFWLFMAWTAVVLGVAYFFMASGILWVGLGLAAFVCLIPPITPIGFLLGFFAFLAWGGQLNALKAVREASRERVELWSPNEEPVARDQYRLRRETQELGDELGRQALRHATEKLEARTKTLKEFDVEAFKRKMAMRKAGG